MKTPVLFKIAQIKNFKTKENKETLLSLANPNKSYKNINEAKKELNVKTADEAYTLLQNNYNAATDKYNENFKIMYNKDKEKHQKNNETKRNKVIQAMIKRNKEINQKIKTVKNERKHKIEETFDVNISVTYKEIIIKTSWENIKNKDFLESFTCLKSELEKKVDDFLNDFFPFRDDYRDLSLIKYTFQVIQKMKKVEKQDVPMKRGAIPLKITFLKYFYYINEISYKDHKDRCVIEILKEHLNIKKEKTITDVMKEASLKLYDKSWKVEDGVTARMIKYFCKVKNISCLGFDQKSKVFVKHIRDEKIGHNYNSIIFYCVVGHFYIVNDKDAVREISQTFKENNSITTSIVDEIDKKEYQYLEFWDLFKFYEDGECDELEESEKQQSQEIQRDYDKEFDMIYELKQDTVIIYHQGNLNVELNKYIEIYGEVPNVKYESLSNVKQIILKKRVYLNNKNKNKKKEYNLIKFILTTTDNLIETSKIKRICLNQNLDF